RDLPLVLGEDGHRPERLLVQQVVHAGAGAQADQHQRQIAGRFAMKGRVSDRLLFADLACDRGEVTGAPLIPDALASLECRTEQRVEAGDHTLVIGRVLTARVPSTEGGPLLYYRGRYRHLG
uniref:flavin reductase family protein n=1 Tax=Streptomyces recifensis TaxID=67355 RepID=UPI00111E6E3D